MGAIATGIASAEAFGAVTIGPIVYMTGLCTHGVMGIPAVNIHTPAINSAPGARHFSPGPALRSNPVPIFA